MPSNRSKKVIKHQRLVINLAESAKGKNYFVAQRVREDGSIGLITSRSESHAHHFAHKDDAWTMMGILLVAHARRGRIDAIHRPGKPKRCMPPIVKPEDPSPRGKQGFLFLKD